MYMGLGIFMLAVGAILRFAVSAKVSGLNINVIGTILMVAGILAIAISFIMMYSRPRRTTVVRQVPTGTDPNHPTQVTTTEYPDDPNARYRNDNDTR